MLANPGRHPSTRIDHSSSISRRKRGRSIPTALMKKILLYLSSHHSRIEERLDEKRSTKPPVMWLISRSKLSTEEIFVSESGTDASCPDSRSPGSNAINLWLVRAFSLVWLQVMVGTIDEHNSRSSCCLVRAARNLSSMHNKLAVTATRRSMHSPPTHRKVMCPKSAWR